MQQQKEWLVIARDNTLAASQVYLVRGAASEKEYERQGWGVPDRLDAYRLGFRGNQTVKQVCKVFDSPLAPAIPDEGAPLVEWA